MTIGFLFWLLMIQPAPPEVLQPVPVPQQFDDIDCVVVDAGNAEPQFGLALAYEDCRHVIL